MCNFLHAVVQSLQPSLCFFPFLFSFQAKGFQFLDIFVLQGIIFFILLVTLQWTLCILSLKWTLSVATSVVCWVFVPLCSCFSEKGKLGLLWPVRSHMFLIICGGMQVLARMAPSLWLSSGSRCLGFYLPYYSAWCLLMSCLPCGSSGSSAANHFLHYSLLLQLCFLKVLSVVLH